MTRRSAAARAAIAAVGLAAGLTVTFAAAVSATRSDDETLVGNGPLRDAAEEKLADAIVAAAPLPRLIVAPAVTAAANSDTGDLLLRRIIRSEMAAALHNERQPVVLDGSELQPIVPARFEQVLDNVTVTVDVGDPDRTGVADIARLAAAVALAALAITVAVAFAVAGLRPLHAVSWTAGALAFGAALVPAAGPLAANTDSAAGAVLHTIAGNATAAPIAASWAAVAIIATVTATAGRRSGDRAANARRRTQPT